MHPLDIGPVAVPSGPQRMSLYSRLTHPNLTNALPTHRLQRKGSNVTTAGSVTGAPAPVSPSQTPVPTQPPTAAPLRSVSPTFARRTTQSGVPYMPILESVNHAVKDHGLPAQPLPPNLTTDDFTRAVAVATVSALRHQQTHPLSPARGRASGVGEHEEGHGGHEGPSWSRALSASVLLGCTFLYAIIAGASLMQLLCTAQDCLCPAASEILVDGVDVVLEGSGIQEKFLGVTLFALVPNVTEFMNAISFAINGNIALRCVHLWPFFFSFSVGNSGTRITAWRLGLLTHCKCASSKFLQWSPSRRGITLGAAAPSRTPSRASPTPELQRRR